MLSFEVRPSSLFFHNRPWVLVDFYFLTTQDLRVYNISVRQTQDASEHPGVAVKAPPSSFLFPLVLSFCVLVVFDCLYQHRLVPCLVVIPVREKKGCPRYRTGYLYRIPSSFLVLVPSDLEDLVAINGELNSSGEWHGTKMVQNRVTEENVLKQTNELSQESHENRFRFHAQCPVTPFQAEEGDCTVRTRTSCSCSFPYIVQPVEQRHTHTRELWDSLVCPESLWKRKERRKPRRTRRAGSALCVGECV